MRTCPLRALHGNTPTGGGRTQTGHAVLCPAHRCGNEAPATLHMPFPMSEATGEGDGRGRCGWHVQGCPMRRWLHCTPMVHHTSRSVAGDCLITMRPHITCSASSLLCHWGCGEANFTHKNLIFAPILQQEWVSRSIQHLVSFLRPSRREVCIVNRQLIQLLTFSNSHCVQKDKPA